MKSVSHPSEESVAEDALSYAALGWKVFPLHSVRDGTCTCSNPTCTNPGKHPRTVHGLKDATTDPEQIRSWWEQWPDANVGIATGVESGLVVVDIDPRHAGTLEALGDYLPTYTVRSGGNGWHLYFRYPDGMTIRNNASGKLGQGIDIRGNSGYVVAPPSVHASGERYTWLETGEIADLPEHLVARLQSTQPTANKHREESTDPVTSERGRQWLERAVQRVCESGQGRNDTGFWLACQLRDAGIQQAEAEGLMAVYTDEVADAGDHTYTREEALASLSQAYGAEAREPALRHPMVATPCPEKEFTDAGNADRLARDYGDRIKYVREWGWLAYEDGRWVRHAEGAVMRYAEACINDMLQEAARSMDRARRDDLLDHARRSFSQQRLRAMVELAKYRVGIEAHTDEFDTDPWLLNVQNGTVDLHTGTLRPYDPADRITKIVNVVYDPAAKAPRWEQFVREIFLDDENLVSYVQRAIGYSLTGSTQEQVFFLCYGAGANGKSTLLGVIAHILGDYAKPLKADALLSSPYRNGSSADPEIAALVGSRFVSAQEPGGGAFDAAKLKELTGGDAMQVRELHQMPFTFTPHFKLWLSTNELPDVKDTTTGIWRRIRQIPFNARFETKGDPDLPAKLRAEAEGILAWMVAGAVAWAQQGLGEAQAVQEATREYREAEDPYLEFFQEVLVQAEVTEKVEGTEAYEAFQDWQRRVQALPLDLKGFYRQAEAHGYAKKRSNGKRWLMGGQLIPSAASAANPQNAHNLSNIADIESYREKSPSATLPQEERKVVGLDADF
jgi:putative DNA primase/helicase